MTRSGPILVTGASGFVGSHVVDRLSQLDRPVVTIDHAWSTAAEVNDLVRRAAPAACIHLGWYAGPSDYLTNRVANLTSLRQSLDLVDALGAAGCRRLVVAGSCAEYGPSDGPLGEDDLIAPWSAYGAAKTSLQVLLASSWCPDDLRVTWARLFNLTGPGEHPDRLVPMVTGRLIDGLPVDLSDGTQLRDYLDVADVADALVALSAGATDGPVNVCSGHGVTVRALLSAIADRVGGADLLQFGARIRGPHDADVVVGRPDRLQAAGWAPQHSFENMIDRVVAWWRDAIDPSQQ